MTAAERVPVPSVERRRVLFEAACAYCGCPTSTEVDHVLPVAQGGTNDPDNLAPACSCCNREKSAQTPEQWRAARLAKGQSWPPAQSSPPWAEFAVALMNHVPVEAQARLTAAISRNGAVGDVFRRLMDANRRGCPVPLPLAFKRLMLALPEPRVVGEPGEELTREEYVEWWLRRIDPAALLSPAVRRRRAESAWKTHLYGRELASLKAARKAAEAREAAAALRQAKRYGGPAGSARGDPPPGRRRVGRPHCGCPVLTDLCPDCAARPTGEVFQHAESCPLIRNIVARRRRRPGVVCTAS